MPTIRIQIDERFLADVDRWALPNNQTRAEFISRAIKDAVRKREHELIREAYLRQPDTDPPAGEWAPN